MPRSFGIVSPVKTVICSSTVSCMPIAGREEMNDQRIAEAVGDSLEERGDK